MIKLLNLFLIIYLIFLNIVLAEIVNVFEFTKEELCQQMHSSKDMIY